MPQHCRDHGFRSLTARIKSGNDETAWDELLERILPELWRAAIQTLGDGDPPAIGRLVGSTLVVIAAELDDFQPGEDDPATYVAFRDWWGSLMLAAARGIQPTPDPPESKDWPVRHQGQGGRPATSRPRFDASLLPGKRLSTLVQGMASPPSDAEREKLLHEMLPGLWRAAIHMLGDEQPRRVALLVEETVTAVLVHLGDAPVTEDDSAFDRWWHGLMIHVASLLRGQDLAE